VHPCSPVMSTHAPIEVNHTRRRSVTSPACPSAGDAKAIPTKAATGWSSYVPWGRKLTGSEKFYWGLGVVAAGLIGYKRWSGRETEEERLVSTAHCTVSTSSCPEGLLLPLCELKWVTFPHKGQWWW
jgi:hypothetical protein